MTDDELERLLLTLPSDEPPAGLHAAILAATVERPALRIEAWEIWTVGTLIAFSVWLAYLVVTSVADPGVAIVRVLVGTIDRAGAAWSRGTFVWTAFGVSLAVAVLQLSLPARRSRVSGRS